jgi:transcriptional regulator with XRE-family HTH domain
MPSVRRRPFTEGIVAEDHSPTLRRWELGGTLRRIREEQGRTIEQVAEDLSELHGSGFSAAKIGRLETGQRGANPRDVRDLCDYYELDPDERDRLVALAREVRQSSRVLSINAAYDEFVALESIAKTIRTFEPIFVPGLLQTAEYFQALFEGDIRAGARPEFTADSLEVRAAIRERRQLRLTGDDAIICRAIIDENVIRRHVGSPQIMADQLAHLVELSRKPNIILRVIPISAGVYPGWEASGFVLLEYDQSENLRDNACFVDGLVASLLSEQAATRQRLGAIFAYMEKVALEPAESRALIEEARRSIAQAPPLPPNLGLTL